jgi:hypothetical protein
MGVRRRRQHRHRPAPVWTTSTTGCPAWAGAPSASCSSTPRTPTLHPPGRPAQRRRLAWFTGAKAEREELGDFNTNSLQLRFGRTKSADRIDRNYYLQYDFTKLQGTGAPTSSSSITANYGWTGRYFNNPISPTSGFGFAWEVGAGTTLTPEREPFGRVSARWLTLIGLGDPDQAGRQSRLACVPPAAP